MNGQKKVKTHDTKSLAQNAVSGRAGISQIPQRRAIMPKAKKDEKDKKGQPQSKDRQRKQGMAKEDAERILRAVGEREKQTMRQSKVQQRPTGAKDASVREDW